jgi:hypothetical protein
MIPIFPIFKKLTLSDKKSIDSITSGFEPYSNYNFANLWSWDYDKSVKISRLNGNLVVMCNDHFLTETCINFLGNNKINETLETLFLFLRTHHLEPVLNSVPRISVQGANPDLYEIVPNRSSYDYIYDLNSLAYFTEPKYSHKRKAANQFFRKFPSAKLKTLNLATAQIRTNIQKLNKSWLSQKDKVSTKIEFQHESSAIKRFIDGNFSNSLCLGLYVDNILAGYSCFSLLDGGFTLCQFSKADTRFYGVYEYLMRESASFLVTKGYKKLNYEEDLGMEGLRQAKLSYKPLSFLEKYNVREL